MNEEKHTPESGEVPITTVTLAAPFALGGEPPPRDPRTPIPRRDIDNDPADVTFGRKSVLRSIIGGDRGDPEIQRLLAANFNALEKHCVEWDRPDDQAIYAFVRDYCAEHGGGVPGIAVVRDHFERLDDLLVTERIKDIENVRGWFGSNFTYGLRQIQEEDRKTQNIALVREAADKVRQGADAADVFSEMARRAELLKPEGQKKRRGISHVGPAEIFASLGPIPWMCEGLKIAPGAGVCILGGYGFSKKTITVQHMALCFASGKPIFGVHPVRQGRVLHLDYEQGHRLTAERYQRLARGMGIEWESLGDNLRLAVFPEVKMDDPDAEALLKAELQDGFDVAIIDPWRAACPSTKENDSSARGPLDMVNRACGDRTVGVFLHHAVKPPAEGPGRGKRFSLRGSGALYDAAASVFIFGTDDDDKNGPSVVSHEKEKWRGVLLDEFGIRIEDVAREGDGDWGLKVEYLDEDELAALKEASKGANERSDEDRIVAYLSNLPDRKFTGNQKALGRAVKLKDERRSVAMVSLRRTQRVIIRQEDGKTAIVLTDKAGSFCGVSIEE